MLRRLAVSFLRWLADSIERGLIEKARKEAEWQEQRDDFEDASERWDAARRSRDASEDR